MINIRIGQRFKSQSKIQDMPVEYIYKGFLPNGNIFLESTTGNPLDNCEVEPQWFNERKINLGS